MTEALFPRSFRKDYAQAVRGSGCYLYTTGGKKLLDATGGAAVVTIGHGVKEVARAMAKQAETLAYVHSSQFVTPAAEQLLKNCWPSPLRISAMAGESISHRAARKPRKPR